MYLNKYKYNIDYIINCIEGAIERKVDRILRCPQYTQTNNLDPTPDSIQQQQQQQ